MSNVSIPILPASPPEYNGEQITRNFDDITRTIQQVVDELDNVTTTGTDLSYDDSTRTIESSTGTDAVLPIFTDLIDGLVPQSDGGTTDFLRADGTWDVPFTEAQVRSTPLTGFVAGTDTAIVATDTILQFANKTQGQINRRSRAWRDWVDPRDYGLLMNNLEASAAANTTALQAAINTGKIVAMSDGDFWANAVTVDTPYQQILGTGKTRWRQPAAFNGNLITVNLAAEGVTWQGMRFDGNRANVTYSYNSSTFLVFAPGFTADDLELKDIQSMGIRGAGTCDDFTATRIKLENLGDFGIFVFESGGIQPLNGTIRDIRIKEFGISSAGGASGSVGIGVRSATGGWVVDDFKIQCDNAYPNDQLGVEFWTNSNGNTVSNGHVIFRGGGTGEFGISATGRNNIVKGIRVEGTDSYAYEIIDRGCAVSACIARDPRGAGFAVNLGAEPGADNLTLTGCVVENANSTDPQFAAFVLDGVLGVARTKGVSLAGCSASGSAVLVRVGQMVDGYAISGFTGHKTGGTNTWMSLGGNNGSVTNTSLTAEDYAGTISTAINIYGDNVTIGSGTRINGKRVYGANRITHAVLVNAGYKNINIDDLHATGVSGSLVFSNATGNHIFVSGGSCEVGLSLQPSNRALNVLNTGNNTLFSQAPATDPVPTLTSISPTSGPTAGGTTITFTGTNYAGTMSATVNGVACTSVTLVNATTVTAVSPAGTAGAKYVTIANSVGSAFLESAFTYT